MSPSSSEEDGMDVAVFSPSARARDSLLS